MRICKFYIVMGLLMIALLFVSCKNKDVLEVTDAHEVSESNQDTLSEITIESISGEDNSLFHSTSAGDNEMDNEHVKWAIHVYPRFSVELQQAIIHFIEERGICEEIEFIYVSEMGDDYAEWLNEQKITGMAPDILSSVYWLNGAYDAADFVTSEFLPLNEYLSLDGRDLYNNFSSLEWEQKKVNGVIYSIPTRFSNLNEMYVYVDRQYATLFENSFDGTYDSLRDICLSCGKEDAIIASYLFGVDEVTAFLGYKNDLLASYGISSGSFDDLTKDSRLASLLHTIYSDFQNGVRVAGITPDNIPSNTFAYISSDKVEDDRFKEYILCPNLFTTVTGISFGVLASSPRKELALQVLSACCSDPEMASYIYWGNPDKNGWAARTEYYNDCSESLITGFLPNLSQEERKIVSQYNKDLTRLVEQMVTIQSNQVKVNSNYTRVLESFFNKSRDYGNVFDEINNQLNEWRSR